MVIAWFSVQLDAPFCCRLNRTAFFLSLSLGSLLNVRIGQNGPNHFSLGDLPLAQIGAVLAFIIVALG